MKLAATVSFLSYLALQGHSTPLSDAEKVRFSCIQWCPVRSHTRLLQRAVDQACGFATVPLLRAFNPTAVDHFYTTNISEMEIAVGSGSYVSQGDAGYVLPSQAPNSVPLYRMYHPVWIDHMYTVDEAEKEYATTTAGYVDQGITAYVFPSGVCETVEFYRVYNPVAVDHFYTTNATEKEVALTTQDYVDEGNAGYISLQ